MTTQTNTTPGGLSPRLEIASRIVTGIFADGDEFGMVRFPSDIDARQVADAGLKYADALLAADAESRKEEPAKVFDVDIVELRRELLSLSAQLERVTKERDEAQELLRISKANREYLRSELARVTTGRDADIESLRAQLDAALAPLPEEEGLEELDADVLAFAQKTLREGGMASILLAHHALASNARMKARKAREEGRQA